MTTSVDPRLIAEINQIRPRCDTRTATTRERCDEPSAWVLTWTTLHGPRHRATTLACLGCFVQITAHLRGHGPCRDAFTITAVEL